MNTEPKKTGRPRIGLDVATQVVHVRLTVDGKARWATAAAATGLTVGGWVRKNCDAVAAASGGVKS